MAIFQHTNERRTNLPTINLEDLPDRTKKDGRRNPYLDWNTYLLRLAESGYLPPSRNEPGYARWTQLRRPQFADHPTRQNLKRVAPHWFLSCEERDKITLFALAWNGGPRPGQNSSRLGMRLRNFSSATAGMQPDSLFVANLKEVRPDWFDFSSLASKGTLKALGKAEAFNFHEEETNLYLAGLHLVGFLPVDTTHIVKEIKESQEGVDSERLETLREHPQTEHEGGTGMTSLAVMFKEMEELTVKVLSRRSGLARPRIPDAVTFDVTGDDEVDAFLGKINLLLLSLSNDGDRKPWRLVDDEKESALLRRQWVAAHKHDRIFLDLFRFCNGEGSEEGWPGSKAGYICAWAGSQPFVERFSNEPQTKDEGNLSIVDQNCFSNLTSFWALIDLAASVETRKKTYMGVGADILARRLPLHRGTAGIGLMELARMVDTEIHGRTTREGVERVRCTILGSGACKMEGVPSLRDLFFYDKVSKTYKRLTRGQDAEAHTDYEDSHKAESRRFVFENTLDRSKISNVILMPSGKALDYRFLQAEGYRLGRVEAAENSKTVFRDLIKNAPDISAHLMPINNLLKKLTGDFHLAFLDFMGYWSLDKKECFEIIKANADLNIDHLMVTLLDDTVVQNVRNMGVYAESLRAKNTTNREEMLRVAAECGYEHVDSFVYEKANTARGKGRPMRVHHFIKKGV